MKKYPLANQLRDLADEVSSLEAELLDAKDLLEEANDEVGELRAQIDTQEVD